jgi:hypothetical protein
MMQPGGAPMFGMYPQVVFNPTDDVEVFGRFKLTLNQDDSTSVLNYGAYGAWFISDEMTLILGYDRVGNERYIAFEMYTDMMTLAIQLEEDNADNANGVDYDGYEAIIQGDGQYELNIALVGIALDPLTIDFEVEYGFVNTTGWDSAAEYESYGYFGGYSALGLLAGLGYSVVTDEAGGYLIYDGAVWTWTGSLDAFVQGLGFAEETYVGRGRSKAGDIDAILELDVALESLMSIYLYEEFYYDLSMGEYYNEVQVIIGLDMVEGLTAELGIDFYLEGYAEAEVDGYVFDAVPMELFMPITLNVAYNLGAINIYAMGGADIADLFDANGYSYLYTKRGWFMRVGADINLDATGYFTMPIHVTVSNMDYVLYNFYYGAEELVTYGAHCVGLFIYHGYGYTYNPFLTKVYITLGIRADLG